MSCPVPPAPSGGGYEPHHDDYPPEHNAGFASGADDWASEDRRGAFARRALSALDGMVLPGVDETGQREGASA